MSMVEGCWVGAGACFSGYMHQSHKVMRTENEAMQKELLIFRKPLSTQVEELLGNIHGCVAQIVQQSTADKKYAQQYETLMFVFF